MTQPSSRNADTLVTQGVNLKKVITTSNLQSGIQAAYRIINEDVTRL